MDWSTLGWIYVTGFAITFVSSWCWPFILLILLSKGLAKIITKTERWRS